MQMHKQSDYSICSQSFGCCSSVQQQVRAPLSPQMWRVFNSQSAFMTEQWEVWGRAGPGGRCSLRPQMGQTWLQRIVISLGGIWWGVAGRLFCLHWLHPFSPLNNLWLHAPPPHHSTCILFLQCFFPPTVIVKSDSLRLQFDLTGH